MSILDQLFNGKLPSVDVLDQKLTELDHQRSKKSAEQLAIKQSIEHLRTKVQETLEESALNEDSGAARRRRELRDQMVELRRKHDELTEEIDALEPLKKKLERTKLEAKKRLQLEEWDRNSAEIVKLSKEITPQIAAMGAALRAATKNLDRLQIMTWTSATYSPWQAWRDSIRALLALHTEGAHIPGLPKETDINSQFLAEASAFSERLEKHLKFLRDNIPDPPSME